MPYLSRRILPLNSLAPGNFPEGSLFFIFYFSSHFIARARVCVCTRARMCASGNVRVHPSVTEHR